MGKQILNGVEYCGSNSNFALKKIVKYEVTPTLVTGQTNLIKTISANTLQEGWYLISIRETYERNTNRSWLYIQGTANKFVFPDTDTNEYIDVRYDASGWTDFVRSIIVHVINPTTEIKFYLYGNGYSPNKVYITINKFN